MPPASSAPIAGPTAASSGTTTSRSMIGLAATAHRPKIMVSGDGAESSPTLVAWLLAQALRATGLDAALERER